MSQPTSLICPNGHEVPPGSAFCNTCGVPLEPAAPAPADFWCAYFPWHGAWADVQFTDSPSLEETVQKMTDLVNDRMADLSDNYHTVFVGHVESTGHPRSYRVLEWRPLIWVTTRQSEVRPGYLPRVTGHWVTGEPVPGPG